jgi:hypothetical protein
VYFQNAIYIQPNMRKDDRKEFISPTLLNNKNFEILMLYNTDSERDNSFLAFKDVIYTHESWVQNTTILHNSVRRHEVWD